MQDIPLNRIQESKTNPRRTFDEAKLAELAGNIRQHGVLQPVLVRPLPDSEDGFFELAAGARRYRASKLAKRETIPATVRELTDTECLELQLIENLQRADVHELDEARGYAALMQLQPDTYTVETLAEKIGRSEKYVYARLRLTHLVEEVQQAFYMDKLTVAHAFEIARLQPNDQRRALAECFPQHRTTAALLKDKKAEAVTVRSLREWIESEIHLDISNAPFDAQDETLLPVAGSCAACPKQTGNNPLQSDIAKFAAGGIRGFFSRHPASNQFLNLLFEVLPNLFGEITVEPPPREHSFKPTHDSILLGTRKQSLIRTSGPQWGRPSSPVAQECSLPGAQSAI
jgi:ParB family chromosome partitioning protein